MYAGVVFPLPVEKEFDYFVPENLEDKIQIGQRVVVSWHGRKATGYVVSLKKESDYKNCQPVIRIIDNRSVLNQDDLALARWLKENYFCSFGRALATVLPPETKFLPDKNYSVPPDYPERNTPGNLPELNLVPGQFYWWPDFPVRAEKEIYPVILKSAFDYSRRSILFLVPDVFRAKQLFNRLIDLTDLPVILWHSDLSSRQKARLNSGWRPVIVATRGGLFLPGILPDKIIVEDEFSIGQHQDSEPFYYLRDVSAFVARQKKAVLIFVEKFPSAAVSKAVFDGRINVLKTSEKNPIPVSILPQEPSSREIFSPHLRQKIQENLLVARQVVLVHSQAGYSRRLECQRCQTIITCENCSVFLRYYKEKNILFCPYCGKSIPVPKNCPKCSGAYFTPRGIGRERLLEYLANDFSGYRIAVDFNNSPEPANIVISGIKPDERLIDRNRLGLVVFLNLDAFVVQPNFTAAEETFRIVGNFTQYFSDTGEIIILTHYSEHYVFQALKDFDFSKFWAEELSLRQAFSYPPVKTMLIFNLRCPSRIRGEKIIQDCFQKISQVISSEEILLGPVETVPHKFRKKFHWQIILKVSLKRRKEVFGEVRQVLEKIKLPENSYLKVSVEGSFYDEVT